MATEQQKSSITPSQQNELISPALLWVGNHDNLVARTIDFLQQTLCPKNNCKICVTCNQINQQEHHAVVWINPEKHYTLDDIEIIHHTIAFKLENNQHFFFVLQKADYQIFDGCLSYPYRLVYDPVFHLLKYNGQRKLSRHLQED